MFRLELDLRAGLDYQQVADALRRVADGLIVGCQPCEGDCGTLAVDGRECGKWEVTA